MAWDTGIDHVFITLASLAVVKLAIFYMLKERRIPRSAKLVGTVAKLNAYPVKSLLPVELNDADCTVLGLQHGNIKDRHWMVTREVTHEKHVFCSQRQEGSMAQVQPSLHGDALHLDAPGMETLKLPANPKLDPNKVVPARVHDDLCQGQECGDEAAEWLQRYLKRPDVRMVCKPDELRGRVMVEGSSKYHKTCKKSDETAFPDFSPYMFLSEESVADLNSRLQSPVPMLSFRPNLVVSGSKCAYDEDTWGEVYIGDAKFTKKKLCDRCVLTTVDPETGMRRPSGEPLATLRKYRLIEREFGNSPCFGIQLVLDRPGKIRVGDPIYAIPEQA